MTSANAGLGVTGFMNAAFGFRVLFFAVAVFFFAVLAIYSPLEDARRRQRVVSRNFAHHREEKCNLALIGSRFSSGSAGAKPGRVLEVRKVAVAILRVARSRPLLDDDLDRVALVFIEHVVDSARRGGANLPAPFAPGEHNNHRDDCHEPDNGGYDVGRHAGPPFSNAPLPERSRSMTLVEVDDVVSQSRLRRRQGLAG